MPAGIRITLVAVCLCACFGAARAQPPPVTAEPPAAQGADVKNPGPELVGRRAEGLSITPEQATGGLGLSSASPEAD